MTELTAQIVVAVHQVDRPIRRACESVLSCPEAGVIVVAHGVDPQDLDLPDSSRLEVVACAEGIGFPGVPFNRGIASARADLVGVMGSDDWFEEGALTALISRQRADRADVVLAPLTFQGAGRELNPLTWRNRQLQAARDRLFYRTAPLGLIRRELAQNPRYQFREDVHVGEDFQPGVRLWTDGLSVSYYPQDPAYTVGSDARERVTLRPRALADRLAPIELLLADPEVRALPRRTRTSLAVKLLRVHVLGTLEQDAQRDALTAQDWRHFAQLTRKIAAFAPPARHRFTAADQRLLAAVVQADADGFTRELSGRSQLPLWTRILPRNPFLALTPEANLRSTAVGKVIGKQVRQRPPAGRKLLIISYSNIPSDARVLKQVQRLSQDWEVTTCSYGPAPDGVAHHFSIPPEAQKLDLYGRYITLHWYRLAYWRQAAVAASWRLLKGNRFDLILADEVDALPVAVRLRPRVGILVDLHEHTPSLMSQIPLWDRRIRPYYEWLCRLYLPQSQAATTVGEGIAVKYEELTGVRPSVVTNATPYQDLSPQPVNEPIRLVHHGVAQRARAIHLMIEALIASPRNFTFDLYLMPNEPAYLEELKALADQSQGKVRVLDPLPYRELVPTLNQYDLGIFVLPPVSLNKELALPNKFFDFVQARLGILIGPSVEMASIVNQLDLGLVTDDFSVEATVRALDGIDADQVARWKQNSDRAARALSAETQVEEWARQLKRIWAQSASRDAR
ncbi:glycosyltransferase [Scrofimicrobium sp. R131]|uniref:Glycosyltransferase 2-like domain-containing protein n=1 Tax=Scrofimicrobium appendicitidis TaxID=3079930 RepID=A0AAU7V8X3_9ACTO